MASRQSDAKKFKNLVLYEMADKHIAAVTLNRPAKLNARKTPWMRTHKGEASEAIQDIAWKAQKRLCQRYRHLMARGKQSVQASTAVARELAGFIWAVGQAVPGPAAH